MNLRPFRHILPQLGKRVYLDAAAVVIGDVVLADDVSVWPCAVVRGDVNHIRIGARSNIQDGSVLLVSGRTAAKPEGSPLIVGEDVTVGHRAVLHGCTIGNRVLIGMGAVVLDDAVIADDVIIGAGSLVPPRKRLEGGFLYTGSPAKAARELTAQERAFLVQSAANYTATAQAYRETDDGTAD